MSPPLFPSLPAQPVDTPWPTAAWPAGGFASAAVARAVQDHLAVLFDAPADSDLGVTHGVTIIQGGRLLAERYGDGHGPDSTCRSWSMAKSITHALVGIAVGDGLIDIHAPADVPAWRRPGDPRGAITLDHLLRMSSGLAWNEDYVDGTVSNVIAMLFGEGKDDVAAYAQAMPQAYPPGAFFYYSSGTTNIVAAILSRAVGLSGEAFHAWMRRRLFEPLGMTSPQPGFDAAGTFIGSSFCYCTPRDFARFGLLYLRDGVWEGRRLLPEGWVDYARTPTFQQADYVGDGYGAHWWLGLGGPGTFSANGHEGQFILLRPDRDLIITRNGKTPASPPLAVKTWLRDLCALFD